MHRFFLSSGPGPGGVLALEERDCHHAVRVLRVEVGEEIEVLDGRGSTYRARVTRAEKRAVEAAVLATHRTPPPPSVALAPALIKGRAMDFLVQKATELGASTLQPLITERTIVSVDDDDAAAKVEHWRTTAIEACKQCGNPWMPRIERPRTLGGWLEAPGVETLLVASLASTARLPGDVLRSVPRLREPLGVVLGPEGDLTATELDQLAAAGAVPITLGPLVLRAETAAIAALAVVQHELRLASAAGA